MFIMTRKTKKVIFGAGVSITTGLGCGALAGVVMVKTLPLMSNPLLKVATVITLELAATTCADAITKHWMEAVDQVFPDYRDVPPKWNTDYDEEWHG